MKTTHTPGPWGYRRAYSNGEPCGMVITPMGYDLNTSNDDENEANARLIAAAPELLEALETIAKIQRADGKDWEALVYLAKDMARAALAKVTL